MKTLKFMLAAATTIGFASASQAVEPLGGSTSFEDGVVPANTVGGYWTLPSGAEEGDYTIIDSGLAADAKRSNGAKLEWATNAKALNLEGGTDPLVRAVGAEPYDLTDAGVYVDTLVQFTVTPYGDTVAAGADDKLMIYLQEVTNGVGTVSGTNLVVKAASYSVQMDPVTGEPTPGSETFTPTEVNVSSVIADKTWYRLTVKSYLLDGVPVFKLFLDGVPLTGSVELWASKGTDVFPSLLGKSDPTLRSVGFAGSGKVDDLLFTTVNPDVTVVDFTIVLAGDMNGFAGDPTWESTAKSGTLISGDNSAVCYAINGEQKATVTYTLVSGQGYSATWSPSDPANGVTANTTYTLTVSQAAAKIGGTDYADLSSALGAAVVGDTVMLYKDATVGASLSTAAATLDLNGKVLSAKSLTFTGDEAKTLKGGDFMGAYGELVITAPASQNLTVDGMTFHASVKPSGSGDLLFFTNCTFKCDKTTSGDDYTVGGTYHSYGIMTALADWSQVEVVDNYFYLSRRSAMEVVTSNDVYFCGNTVDGTVDPLTTSERTEGRAFPALQIFKQGRVFIENNTFTGSFLGEAFALYNEKTNVSTSEPLVFNGNTVDNTVPYLWGFYESPDTPLPTVTNAPNLFFGANTIGANVDKTQGIYKALVQLHPEGCEYAENLALPTGYTTVYDWTHASGTTDYFVNNAFVAGLTGLADGDVLTAVPGADVTGATLTLNADATYKNKWTAAADSGAEFADDGAEDLLDENTSVTADDVATYVAGVTSETAPTVVTKPMVLSYLLNATKILTTSDTSVLKITAIEQVSGGWKITVAADLNATDVTAGATVNLNQINGDLKVKYTSALGGEWTTAEFTTAADATDANKAVVTVTAAGAKFMKATITK